MSEQEVEEYIRDRWQDPSHIKNAFALYLKEENPVLPPDVVLQQLLDLLKERTKQAWNKVMNRMVPVSLLQLVHLVADTMAQRVEAELSEDRAEHMTRRILVPFMSGIHDDKVHNIATGFLAGHGPASAIPQAVAEYLQSDEFVHQLWYQGQLGHEGMPSRYLQEFAFSNLYGPDFAMGLQLKMAFLAPFAQPFSSINLSPTTATEEESPAGGALESLFTLLTRCFDLAGLESAVKDMCQAGKSHSSQLSSALQLPAIKALLHSLRRHWQMKVAKCFLLAYSGLSSLDTSRDRLLSPFLREKFEDEWRCLLLPALTGTVKERLKQTEELYTQLCQGQKEHLVAAAKAVVEKCNLHFEYLVECDISRWLKGLDRAVTRMEKEGGGEGVSAKAGPTTENVRAQPRELPESVSELLTRRNISKHILEDFLLNFLVGLKKDQHTVRVAPLAEYLRSTPALKPLLQLTGDKLIRYVRTLIYDPSSLSLLLQEVRGKRFSSLKQARIVGTAQIQKWVREVWGVDSPQERSKQVRVALGVGLPVNEVVILHFLLLLELQRAPRHAKDYTGKITDNLMDVFDLAETDVVPLRKFINIMCILGQEWWPYKERCKVAKIFMTKKMQWPPPFFDYEFVLGAQISKQYSKEEKLSQLQMSAGALHRLLPGLEQVVANTPEERLSYFEELANLVNVAVPTTRLPGRLRREVEKDYYVVDFMDNESDASWQPQLGRITKTEEDGGYEVEWVDGTKEVTLTMDELREIKTPWSHPKLMKAPEGTARTEMLIKHGYITVMQLQLCCAMIWIDVQQLKFKWARRKLEKALPLVTTYTNGCPSGASESKGGHGGGEVDDLFAFVQDKNTAVPDKQEAAANRSCAVASTSRGVLEVVPGMPKDLEVLRYLYDPNLRGLDPYWDFKDPTRFIASSSTGRSRECSGNRVTPHWTYYGPLDSNNRPVQWAPGGQRHNPGQQFLNPHQLGVFISKGEVMKGLRGRDTAVQGSGKGTRKDWNDRVEAILGVGKDVGEWVRGHLVYEAWENGDDDNNATRDDDDDDDDDDDGDDDEDEGEKEREQQHEEERHRQLQVPARRKPVSLVSISEEGDSSDGGGTKETNKRGRQLEAGGQGGPWRKRTAMTRTRKRNQQRQDTLEEYRKARRLRARVVTLGSDEETSHDKPLDCVGNPGPEDVPQGSGARAVHQPHAADLGQASPIVLSSDDDSLLALPPRPCALRQTPSKSMSNEPLQGPEPTAGLCQDVALSPPRPAGEVTPRTDKHMAAPPVPDEPLARSAPADVERLEQVRPPPGTMGILAQPKQSPTAGSCQEFDAQTAAVAADIGRCPVDQALLIKAEASSKMVESCPTPAAPHCYGSASSPEPGHTSFGVLLQVSAPSPAEASRPITMPPCLQPAADWTTLALFPDQVSRMQPVVRGGVMDGTTLHRCPPPMFPGTVPDPPFCGFLLPQRDALHHQSWGTASLSPWLPPRAFEVMDASLSPVVPHAPPLVGSSTGHPALRSGSLLPGYGQCVSTICSGPAVATSQAPGALVSLGAIQGSLGPVRATQVLVHPDDMRGTVMQEGGGGAVSLAGGMCSVKVEEDRGEDCGGSGPSPEGRADPGGGPQGPELPSDEVHPKEVVCLFGGDWVAIMSNGKRCKVDSFEGCDNMDVDFTSMLKDRRGRWFAIFSNGARAMVRTDEYVV